MQQGWRAFYHGMFQALAYWQLLLLLFAAGLFSALLLALLPALGLAAGLGQRPALQEAAGGVPPWLVLETLLSPAAAGLEPGGRQVIVPGLAAVLILPVVAWLSGAFLAGGSLLTYREAPQRFAWRRFLYGCWRWFGPFLLVGLLQAISLGMILLLGLVVAGIATALAGGWLLWPALALLAALLAGWWLLLEYSRLFAVVEDTRNVVRSFVQAAGFVIRRPLVLLGLYGPLLLLLLLLHALYGWGIEPALPLAWWPLVLLVQQAFVMIRLAVRLARLAGGLNLISQLHTPELFDDTDSKTV